MALARALVVEPSVLLLDEPMGGLDKHRRGSMLAKFREIHRNTGVTFVMVTHDQGEAMTTSSRIAILNHGTIEQAGSPEEVSRRPQTAFVARFVGHKNVFSATVAQVDGARVTVSSSAGTLQAQRRVMERLQARSWRLRRLRRGCVPRPDRTHRDEPRDRHSRHAVG